MELLGDVGHVESRFGPSGDTVCVGLRKVHGLRQTSHRLKNCFGQTRWYSLVTRLRWKLNSVCLEILGILTQDRCIVCAEHTTGSEIIFHSMELLGDVGHVESHIGPSRDSVSVDARWVHGLRQTSHWLKNHFGHT
jgi:hypothetical protein